jgi:hypothetical protein
VWAGTAFAILLAAWLFWTLFVHTASGANRGLSVTLSKATQTAVFEAMPTPTPGAGVVELPATCKGCHLIAGTSLMPAAIGAALAADELDRLVTYLASLK